MSSCQDEHFRNQREEDSAGKAANRGAVVATEILRRVAEHAAEQKEYEVADRYNQGKRQLSYNLLGREAVHGESRVWEYGGDKYDRGNWLKGIPWTEAADSLLRHLEAFLNGEDIDPVDTPEGISPGSGLPHVDHIVCCAKILANSYHTRKDFDDR